MSPMLGGDGEQTAQIKAACLLLNQKFVLALELLSGCGMILGAKLLITPPADGRCHPADGGLQGPLSFRVHPSSVIWCNGLNLLRGSRV
jgi:hypothetical protein